MKHFNFFTCLIVINSYFNEPKSNQPNQTQSQPNPSEKMFNNGIMKLPPTRQFSCIERVNVPNLNRSICHLASTPKLQNDENKYNAFKELRKIKKRAGKEGQYKVNFLLKDFGSTETKALGRIYAKGSSLQYLNREYRKALVYDKYTDIDIENAHPSLISQIFKEQGLKCKTLDDYVANRGKFLEVVDKKEWLALLNNKVPKDDMSSLEKEYWNDVISCATDLFQKPVFTFTSFMVVR